MSKQQCQRCLCLSYATRSVTSDDPRKTKMQRQRLDVIVFRPRSRIISTFQPANKLSCRKRAIVEIPLEAVPIMM